MLTRADQISEKYRHPLTYFKSALGLVLLREQILGPERFDWAFRKFIARLVVQASVAIGFLPRHGKQRRRGSVLVLARLVFQQLEARSGGRERRSGRGRLE